MSPLSPSTLFLPHGIFVIAGAGGDSTTGVGWPAALTVPFADRPPAGSVSAGTVLDPSSTVDAFAIAQDIGLSLAAFADDDRDGVEDHRR